MRRLNSNFKFHPRDGSPSARVCAAFTLVELLVVITVIALLAGLLLPALAKGKARGKRIQCLSNERQLALTWTMYASDNADNIVPNGQPIEGGSTSIKFWVQGEFYYPQDSTNIAFMVDPKYALFAPYLTSLNTYRCPADDLDNKINGVLYAKIRSYSLNAYVGWINDWDDRLSQPNVYKIFRKTTQMTTPNPASLFTFLDVYPQSICWPYFGVMMSPGNATTFFNFPFVNHNNDGSIGFADGHVESHRWLDPRTLAAKSSDYHAHADSSPNNSDIIWLQQHATSLLSQY